MAQLAASILLRLIDQTGRGTASARRNLLGLQAQVDRARRSQAAHAVSARRQAQAVRDLSSAFLPLSGRVMGPLAVGIAAQQSMARFADFEKRLVLMGNTAETHGVQLQRAGKMIQQVGIDVGLTGTETLAGTEKLIAAGISLSQSVKATPMVARAAVASGGQVEDMANTASAAMQNLQVRTGDIPLVFDQMAKSAKLGKFELKDIAANFPALAAAMSAWGSTGTDATRDLLSMLQTVRISSSDSEQAANDLFNVFTKMTSQETRKKFEKAGVNIEKSLEKARKSGQSVFDAFLDITNLVIKGDLSKVNRIFEDMQAQRGLRALLANRREMMRFRREIGNAGGTLDRDFLKVAETADFKMKRMWASLDRLSTQIGAKMAPTITSITDSISSAFDDMERRSGGALDRLLARTMKFAQVKLSPLEQKLLDQAKEFLLGKPVTKPGDVEDHADKIINTSEELKTEAKKKEAEADLLRGKNQKKLDAQRKKIRDDAERIRRDAEKQALAAGPFAARRMAFVEEGEFDAETVIRKRREERRAAGQGDFSPGRWGEIHREREQRRVDDLIQRRRNFDDQVRTRGFRSFGPEQIGAARQKLDLFSPAVGAAGARDMSGLRSGLAEAERMIGEIRARAKQDLSAAGSEGAAGFNASLASGFSVGLAQADAFMAQLKAKLSSQVQANVNVNISTSGGVGGIGAAVRAARKLNGTDDRATDSPRPADPPRY